MSASGEVDGEGVERLRARIAELERELAGHREAVGGAGQDLKSRVSLLEAVLDSCPIYIYAKDADGRYLLVNRAMGTMLGKEADQILGKTDYDIFSKENADLFRSYDLRVLGGASDTSEDAVEVAGRLARIVTAKFPVRDADGKVYATCSVTTDVSQLREAEAENLRLQEQMFHIQGESLRALSTPLLPIAKGVVLMPLLGHLDQQRAQDVLEKLLDGVSSFQASIVILDITGVPMVDTGVASALMRTAKAVKLLGADVVLTGVQPPIAQAIVGLEIDLAGVIIRNTLQSGIAYALARA